MPVMLVCDHGEEMPVKLHRCSARWLKGGHPCWQLQKALDEAGIEYELAIGPLFRSKHDEIVRLSGQRYYPVIEFEDGRAYREESRDMAVRIRAGTLTDAQTTIPAV